MSRYASMGAHLALGLLLSGCAAGYRLGAGPTVDTEGHVGGVVTVAGGFGIGSTTPNFSRTDPDDAREHGWALLFVVEGGAGGQSSPGGATLDYGVGYDFVRTRNRDLAYRIGLRMRAHWIFAEGQDALGVGVEAVAAGAWGGLADYHLALELRAGVRTDDFDFTGSSAGTFALAVVYDRVGIRNLHSILGF